MLCRFTDEFFQYDLTTFEKFDHCSEGEWVSFTFRSMREGIKFSFVSIYTNLTLFEVEDILLDKWWRIYCCVLFSLVNDLMIAVSSSCREV